MGELKTWITQEDLTHARELLEQGRLADMYDYLTAHGAGYAVLAKSVVTRDALGLEFLELMAERQDKTPTADELRALAWEYLNTLARIGDDNDGVVERDIEADEAQALHARVLKNNRRGRGRLDAEYPMEDGGIRQAMESSYRARAASEARVDITIAVVLGIEAGIVAIATYTLPSDILTNNPLLQQSIQWLSTYVSSLVRYDRMSAFPEVAQLVWTAELLLVPFWTVWTIKLCRPNLAAMRKRYWLALIGIPFCALMVWAIVAYMPGSPDGAAWSSEVSRTLLESKAGFAFWSVIIALGVAVFIAMGYLLLRAIPEIFSFRRK